MTGYRISYITYSDNTRSWYVTGPRKFLAWAGTKRQAQWIVDLMTGKAGQSLSV